MRLQMPTNDTRKLDKTRWIALVAGVLLMTTLGFGFLWSLMVNPMIEERGATDASMATIYSALTLTSALMTIVGGKLVDRFGSTKILLTAAAAFLVGELMSMMPGVTGFAIGQIIFTAWQASVLYIAVYTNIVKLFPDWQGLAIAIVGTGISIGGVYLPPLVQYIIDHMGFTPQFLITGVLFTVIALVALIFFPNAPKNYMPTGYTAPDWDEEDEIVEDGKFIQKDWKMMLKDPVFYMVFIAPILGSATYMLLSYQMSWIAQDILNVTPMQAAFLVSGVSVAGIVCLIFGPIADKMNRVLLMTILYACGAVCVIALIGCGHHGVAYFTVFALGYCFFLGGAAGVHPVVISSLFGTKNFGLNYSICYESVLIAAALSPWLGVIGGSDSGDYTKCFTFCSVLCVIGTILFALIFFIRRNNLEPKPKKLSKEERVALKQAETVEAEVESTQAE